MKEKHEAFSWKKEIYSWLKGLRLEVTVYSFIFLMGIVCGIIPKQTLQERILIIVFSALPIFVLLVTVINGISEQRSWPDGDDDDEEQEKVRGNKE